MNKKTGLSFGEARKALLEGKRVRRSSWPFEDKFIFRQVPSEIPKEVVPKMQSLPQLVKNYFQGTFDANKEHVNAIFYNDQLAMVSYSNVITGFVLSPSDALAEDWEILD